MLSQIIDTIKTLSLKNYPHLQAIYIYGSYASGQETPQSDIDIALLFPVTKEKPELLACSQLSVELEINLKKNIDLVDLRRVSTLLQKEVVMNGERIFTDGTSAADSFEVLVMSFYQKLCEEREEIVREGISSGRFYHE